MSTHHSCEPGSAPKVLRNFINESRNLPIQKEEPKHEKNMKDDLKRREMPPSAYENGEELLSRCTANINKDDCFERIPTFPHGVGHNLLHITHFV